MSLFFVGCKPVEESIEDSLSPEESVEEYFKYWIAKDKEMMNTFVVDNKKIVAYDLDEMTFLELNTLESGGESCYWNDAWYQGPYQYTCVDVTFTIEFKDGHGAGFSNGTYKWHYFLIKETEQSDWLIVMWGI